MQGCHSLGEILAQTVSLKGVVRKETHHVHVYFAFFQRRQGEPHVSPLHLLVHDKRDGKVLPAGSFELDLLLGIDLSVLANERH